MNAKLRGKLSEVPPCETGLHPFRQFIRSYIEDGFGIDEAVKLTKMMEMAYTKFN